MCIFVCVRVVCTCLLVCMHALPAGKFVGCVVMCLCAYAVHLLALCAIVDVFARLIGCVLACLLALLPGCVCSCVVHMDGWLLAC